MYEIREFTGRSRPELKGRPTWWQTKLEENAKSIADLQAEVRELRSRLAQSGPEGGVPLSPVALRLLFQAWFPMTVSATQERDVENDVEWALKRKDDYYLLVMSPNVLKVRQAGYEITDLESRLAGVVNVLRNLELNSHSMDVEKVEARKTELSAEREQILERLAVLRRLVDDNPDQVFRLPLECPLKEVYVACL